MPAHRNISSPNDDSEVQLRATENYRLATRDVDGDTVLVLQRLYQATAYVSAEDMPASGTATEWLQGWFDETSVDLGVGGNGIGVPSTPIDIVIKEAVV